MPEQAADRRAKDVENFEIFRRRGGRLDRSACRAQRDACTAVRYEVRSRWWRPIIQNFGREVGHARDPSIASKTLNPIETDRG
jgi:hypothetical protein